MMQRVKNERKRLPDVSDIEGCINNVIWMEWNMSFLATVAAFFPLLDPTNDPAESWIGAVVSIVKQWPMKPK